MKNFMEPEMKVVRFNAEDIIATSGGRSQQASIVIPPFLGNQNDGAGGDSGVTFS